MSDISTAQIDLSTPVNVIKRTVDLNKPIRKESLYTLFCTEDALAHRFEISLERDGVPITLDACGVAGFFVRYSDRKTIPIVGTIEDGKAVLTLLDTCYAHVGKFAVTIKVTKGSVRTTVFVGEASMLRSRTDELTDEGNVMDIDELLACIADMEAATADGIAAAQEARDAAAEADAAREAIQEDLNQLKDQIDDFAVEKITATEECTPEVTSGKKLELNALQTAADIIDDAYANYMTQTVSPGEKYLFSGRFTVYIGGIFFYNGDTLLGSDHYKTATEVVTDYEICIPENCDTLKINYSNSVVATLKKAIISKTLKLGNASDVFTVEPNGLGNYRTISEACAAAGGGDTIIVYPGVYREQVSIYGKELHIRGIDKYTCILIDSSSDYRTPPLEMNMGSISNMTIIEDASAPPAGIENETVNGHPAKDMAYCIHSDSADGIWNFTKTSFVVENCRLINANRPCIGAGGYPNHTLKVINCEMESGAGVVAGYERGTLYFHSNASQSAPEGQKFSIVGNVIRSGGTLAVYALDAGGSGKCEVEFVNNNVYSTVSGVDEAIVKNDATSDIETFRMLECSFGNNIDTLNYRT